MMKVKQMAIKSLVLAIGAGAPYSLLATSGLTFAPSAHFGIIAPSSMLVFVTLGSFLWLRESLKVSRVVGILLILSGVVFVAGQSLGGISSDAAPDIAFDIAFDIAPDIMTGDLMFVGCGLLWASYTLLAKHWHSARGLPPRWSLWFLWCVICRFISLRLTLNICWPGLTLCFGKAYFKAY
jgi:drug/metabolite transporter (DMT)-like permease